MRYFEIAGGMNLMLSSEEDDIMGMFSNKSKVYKSSIKDERLEEVARNMVTRGILNRHKDDNGIYFEINDNKGVWRL
jgi:cytochrome c-type biogenesis protein CcmE